MSKSNQTADFTVIETVPSIARRLISLIYEAFLLAAVLFLVELVFLLVLHVLGGPATLESKESPTWLRALNFIVLCSVLWGYFGYCWTTAGQTLAMKTWKIEVLTHNQQRLNWQQSSIRFVIALVGTLFFGATYWWALFDRESFFLHDRLSGTQLITMKKKKIAVSSSS
ncbi:RDD family protein [Leeia sp. TBRC 13508]|uniref:RDD family protein n=1 Tax=Leeia speluncae TaxID=2884804 RepID=A0ABS8D791_9NEIS|nr:RDD family protein [Leeia speluncae]MCB6184017.1 RDD family protein [Leeia speluncae]